LGEKIIESTGAILPGRRVYDLRSGQGARVQSPAISSFSTRLMGDVAFCDPWPVRVGCATTVWR
jgi:hypothetical protein